MTKLGRYQRVMAPSGTTHLVLVGAKVALCRKPVYDSWKLTLYRLFSCRVCQAELAKMKAELSD